MGWGTHQAFSLSANLQYISSASRRCTIDKTILLINLVGRKCSLSGNCVCHQAWRQEFSDEMLTLPASGAKIWFSGSFKCQKSPKKSLFTFRLGGSMLRRGGYSPLALPWHHLWLPLLTSGNDSETIRGMALILSSTLEITV